MRFTASFLSTLFLYKASNAWTTPSRFSNKMKTTESKTSLNYIDSETTSEFTTSFGNRDLFLKVNNVVPLKETTKFISSPQWDRLAREYASKALQSRFISFLRNEENFDDDDSTVTIESIFNDAVKLLPTDEMTNDELKWMSSKIEELIIGTWEMRYQYVHFWKKSHPFAVVDDTIDNSASMDDMMRDLVSYNDNVLLQCKSFLNDIEWPDKDDTFENYISVRYSIPLSKVNRWIAKYGKDETEHKAKELRFQEQEC